HIVRAGETLWRIAQRYQVTVQAIAQANNIANPSNIAVGQSLIIPALRHRVVSGENLTQIAQRYNVSLESLIRANNIQNPDVIVPGTLLVIPRAQRPVMNVNGYIYIFGEAAVPIVNEHGRDLTYLAPFAYLIKENGDMEPIDDSPAINAAYSENIMPMMAVTNFTTTSVGENLAHTVLSSPEIRGRLIDNIISISKTKGYGGVNIDFENVLPADRVNYNTFLEEAVTRLHAEGLFLSTALAPKTSATQSGLLYEAHDYEAHGRIADFVVLMTYEWGYRKGPPQAISPLNQIKRVLDYAVTVIPRDKIYFGFQIYARDWLLPFVQGSEAETYSMQEAISRAVNFGTVIQYDAVTQSPFFRYTDEQGRRHEVWFEDARSAQAKFDMVKEYNLGGISYWALGYPFPQNWTLLEDNFTINKLL
ncbi:MAG: LysM peptidoglycan-binding domain-containing protein, partial [Clostridiales bacterium]|nr:LysM peptidoglycan-binding domain-containing protein [Clostridiales bacterium]